MTPAHKSFAASLPSLPNLPYFCEADCGRTVSGGPQITNGLSGMRIVRGVFRLLSAFALLAAIVAGVLDSIQSVSASSVVVTSLGNAWLNLDPESLTLAEISAETYVSPDIWRPFVAPVLAQPAFAVFLVLALVFWMAGYRKPRFAGRFSA